jgi:hypothetical protein
METLRSTELAKSRTTARLLFGIGGFRGTCVQVNRKGTLAAA